MKDGYEVVAEGPSIDDYRRLREVAGLSPKSAEAAAAGLPNTRFAVVVKHDGRVVGMGRVIGDGGLFFQVVDIAVEPAHQGQGLGKAIVGRLVEHLKATAPAGAYVSLIADGEAHRLYAQFGFQPTAPASIGMAFVIR
ncbi:GNAT family N-acetyltransferase [Myxococcus sp. MxC21-1]|uniref:GNAT family N-acetyltransferase n=1 Tax=Myxococcus sp. MxC21-1 TaxID=3041439 RepID=UPI00292D341A|nr:GNAT family N-acetyltransferase [Myxococcus sp. MxC21-1]WNZ58623.1 GNAT family N-acetyltransferase [Myxococcus sp. MxC21-1]